MEKEYQKKLYKDLIELNIDETDAQRELLKKLTGTYDLHDILAEKRPELYEQCLNDYKYQVHYCLAFEYFCEQNDEVREAEIAENIILDNNLINMSQFEEFINSKSEYEYLVDIFKEFKEEYKNDDCAGSIEDYLNESESMRIEIGIEAFININDEQEVISAYRKHNPIDYENGLEQFLNSSRINEMKDKLEQAKQLLSEQNVSKKNTQKI